MTTLKQLQKEKTRLLKKRSEEQKRLRAIQQRQNLRREIFMLKHGRKVEAVTRWGKSAQKGLIKAEAWAEKRQRAVTPLKKTRIRAKRNYGYDAGSLFG